MKVYLVTGAAGFIGSHICEELLKSNNRVIGVDNFYSGKKENIDLLMSLSNLFTFYELDIRDHNSICEVLKNHDIDYIFHEAAIASVQKSIEDPLFTHDVNVKGSLSILEAARKNNVKRVVFASSAAVYGDEPTLPKNESSKTKPISPYGQEKLIVEKYMELYKNQYGLECIALRYFNVYGPRQDPHSEYSGVISIFNNKIKNGNDLTIFGDGEQSRDFIFVKDIVDININLMHINLSEFNFNVVCSGTGNPTTINDLLKFLSYKYNVEKISPKYEPSRIGDIRSSLCDNKLLIKLMGDINFRNIGDNI